jgi:homoserine O-acetyltransferase
MRPLRAFLGRVARPICGALLALGLLAAAGGARAQDAPPPFPVYENDLILHDVVFNDGERMDELKLHYLALGMPKRTPRGEVTNAVLLLHGTTGSGRNFLAPTLARNLFGPGQPLDLAKYFVILPDGVGAGKSSKPSDGLHARFPHYGYKDQVDLQKRLVEQAFGITHLRLVLGTSMGGMQAWLWGERYPDFVDLLVPIAALPAPIAGRNMLWREMIIRAIETDPDWRGGEYDPTHPPRAWLRTFAPLFAIMTGNAERLEQAAPTRPDAIALYDRLVREAAKYDANDMLYAFQSSADYDPTPDLEKIKPPVLAIEFADDLINPPELGIMEAALKRLPQAEYVLIPRGMTYGHQTLNYADIWGHYLAAFLAKHGG